MFGNRFTKRSNSEVNSDGVGMKRDFGTAENRDWVLKRFYDLRYVATPTPEKSWAGVEEKHGGGGAETLSLSEEKRR